MQRGATSTSQLRDNPGDSSAPSAPRRRGLVLAVAIVSSLMVWALLVVVVAQAARESWVPRDEAGVLHGDRAGFRAEVPLAAGWLTRAEVPWISTILPAEHGSAAAVSPDGHIMLVVDVAVDGAGNPGAVSGDSALAEALASALAQADPDARIPAAEAWSVEQSPGGATVWHTTVAADGISTLLATVEPAGGVASADGVPRAVVAVSTRGPLSTADHTWALALLESTRVEAFDTDAGAAVAVARPALVVRESA